MPIFQVNLGHLSIIKLVFGYCCSSYFILRMCVPAFVCVKKNELSLLFVCVCGSRVIALSLDYCIESCMLPVVLADAFPAAHSLG